MTRLRRLSAIGATSLLAIAAIEIFSFAALSFTQGRLMTWGAVKSAQDEARASAGDVDPALDPARAPLPAFISNGVLHPYLGFVLRPDFLARGREKVGGTDALRYGFQLAEPGLFHDRAPGQIVIALTGGSVAHTLAMRAGQILRDEVRRLRPEIDRVVLVNLALPGYKQPQQLISLVWVLALGAHFDAVINLDGFNDVALAPLENIPKGVSAFYPRGWSLQVSDFDPDFQLAAGEIRVSRRMRAERAAAFARAPFRYSYTAGLVWSLWDRRQARVLADREAALVEDPGTRAPSYRVAGPHKAYDDAHELHEDLAVFWSRCSEQMEHLAQGSGAVYLHFLQPNQYVADSKPFSAEERAKAVLEDSPRGHLARSAYPLLQRRGGELKERGLRFFDLTRLFEHETQTLYADSCCHLNPQGNAILARAIARELAAALPGNSDPHAQ